jgi:hypothetical protein
MQTESVVENKGKFNKVYIFILIYIFYIKESGVNSRHNNTKETIKREEI